MGGVPLTIGFQGAARTVTGSRHVLRFGERRWLFDCGLFQGHRDEAERINRHFDFDAAAIEAVVLSHAHLDHAGNLPTLVHAGFAGRIHATKATWSLAAVMLEDSARLMANDVETVNKRDPAHPREPLHSLADVQRTLERFEPHPYDAGWPLDPGLEVTFYDAGHILGSAVTTFAFERDGRRLRLGMSGDLGRPARPILRDPEVPPGVDVLVLEATYGDRLHPAATESERGLAEAVSRTLARGGRVMIAAFAVGRTQEIVATLHALTLAGRVPECPIYVDSPLASKTTDIYRENPDVFDAETRRAFTECHGAPFGFKRLTYVASRDESRALNGRNEPCIIIAGSGMCEGGRIVHHLLHGLGDPKNTLLLVGFQAEGTLGRRLRDGATEVNVLGQRVTRRAEVVSLEGFSAHADQTELLTWVGKLSPAPRAVYLVHAEAAPAEALAVKLRERLPGADVRVPQRGEEIALWS